MSLSSQTSSSSPPSEVSVLGQSAAPLHMWLRWIHERWSLQQKRNFLFISRAIACSVSFLGPVLPGTRFGIVIGLLVVVVVVGGFPGLSGFKPPLVIVVVSVNIASVVVVVEDTSALDSPPGAPVTGDVVVVLVVALTLE